MDPILEMEEKNMIKNKKTASKDAQTSIQGSSTPVSSDGSPGKSIHRNASTDGTNSIHRNAPKATNPANRGSSRFKKK
jgi:hypothetical protein